MLQLLVDAIVGVILVIPVALVFPSVRFGFVFWLALRAFFYLVDPQFKFITAFMQWRYKNRPYEKQLISFVSLSETSLANRITEEYTIICGDTGFPAAALFVVSVARFCGQTKWTRIRVPSNYFGSGTLETQILRILNCEPLDFFEKLKPGEISLMARSDLRSHPALVKELKNSPDSAYLAVQCAALEPAGLARLLYILDPIDDMIFDWQSPYLIAGLVHLFKIYTISEDLLEFKPLAIKK